MAYIMGLLSGLLVSSMIGVYMDRSADKVQSMLDNGQEQCVKLGSTLKSYDLDYFTCSNGVTISNKGPH